MSTKTAEAPARKKREKTVYPTDEIAHLWAHQTQDYAKNPQGNFYFSVDAIYSYGSHFPIARVLKVKRGRKFQNVVFFTTKSYGSTTAGHIYRARRAIPADWPVFWMDNPLRRPEIALQYYVERVNAAKAAYVQLAKTAADATKFVNRAVAAKFAALRVYHNRRDEALRFATYFRFNTKRDLPSCFKNELAALETHEREVAAARVVRREKARAAADARREEKAADWKLRRDDYPAWERLQQERCDEQLKELAAEIETAVARWRRCEPNQLSTYIYRFKLPVTLRINGDVVQTSLGASVPLGHAIRALPLIEAVLTRGAPFDRAVYVGHFTIDRVEADGTLIAGCHRIPKEEVLRLIADIRERGLATSEPVATAANV